VGYRYWKAQSTARWQSGEDMAAYRDLAADVPTRSSDSAALVHRLLAQLPPRDRLVLTLLYLENCSVADIAHQTGWSRGLVKVQAFRARRKLRKILEQHDVHSPDDV
jgi:RNA polymerase sigma-70 factor (ECF subfamily)